MGPAGATDQLWSESPSGATSSRPGKTGRWGEWAGPGRRIAEPVPRIARGGSGHRARRTHHSRGRSPARHPVRHRQDPHDAGQIPAPRSIGMTDTNWHAPAALLARFTDDPRTIDPMTASSIEAHLVDCAECRRQLTAAADPALVAGSWAALADRIDAPRATLVERLLHRLGMTSGVARLLAATPALQAVGVFTVAALAAAAV